jgi:hypothetical protein
VDTENGKTTPLKHFEASHINSFLANLAEIEKGSMGAGSAARRAMTSYFLENG